jgi:hypothetical protein
MQRRFSVQDIDWYGIRWTSCCWNHFPSTGPTVASIWDDLVFTGRNLNDKKKNRLWEDGADDSDDMVVRASHACKSLMAAAIADDRHRDIDP